ncbi:alpha/beta fold hydrolase, partial [Balneolaceae bacterium ANBcel3]|nr:alpha/beta fold hydrolase [Balneolaceae bacterium ANBcel3]
RFDMEGLSDANGLLIQEVAGGTALRIGLKPGDQLLELNGVELNDMDILQSEMDAYRRGDSLSVVIQRDKQKKTIDGLFEGRPKETHEKSEVIYTSAPYRDGLLRVIINKPFTEEERKPALLFIPGYTCTSVDNLSSNHPYKRIVDAFVDAGYVVLRIEKSGMGDSWNTPPCIDEDFHSEVESFRVGLEKLRSLAYVDPHRIVMYGHSMGGVVAPAISSEEDVAGVIVYGTSARSWFEYNLELRRLQNRLAGQSPVEVERSVMEQYEALYRFYIQKEPLAEITQDARLDSLVRRSWGYDGDGRIFSRNKQYWSQIQDFRYMENWKKTTAHVLVQFGESDFQAFSRDDHEQIVRAVNFYNPGHGTLQVFEYTDHYFARSGTMQDAFDKLTGGQTLQLFEEYNPEVGQSAVEWSNTVIGRNGGLN